jgi:PAS domain S-box-containing protein
LTNLSSQVPKAIDVFLPNKAIKRIGIATLFIGTIVIIGWIFKMQLLKSVIPGLIPMRINAAICFVLMGWALLIKNGVQRKTVSIFLILLLLVALIGGMTLLEYQFHLDLDIDQLFVKDNQSITDHLSFPGRMAYNTALSFVLLSFGLLGLTAKFNKFHILFQYFLHVATVISGIAIMGYVYGVSMLYNFAYVSSMAIHTAILLFLLSIAAALLNPKLGVAGLFTGSGIGNRMARKHFTTLMLVLIVFGSLRIQSERFHILPPEVGISLLAISLLVTSLVMIWITASWLNKVDDERSKAEEEIRNINTNLEVKVEERSVKLNTLYHELQKSEERYRSLFEHASDAIYVLNATGDFIDVNESVCNLTGYESEELLRMNITSLLSSDLLQDYPLVYTEVELGKSTIAERKIIRKDGGVLDVEINLKRFTDQRILVIARDITKRKRMEEALRGSEQKYKLLFESNPLPLWIVAKDNMTVITVNDAAAKLYGYTPEEVIGMDIKKLRPTAYWEKLIEVYHIDINEAKDFGIVEHVRKDGTQILVNIIAQDIMFEGRFVRLSSTSDVTEKLKAEELLKTSEANLQTILNNTDTAYALLNDNLEILEYNTQSLIFAKNEFNFGPDSSKYIVDLMSEDRRAQFVGYTKQVFEGKTISYEVNYQQADNSQLWYYVRMFPIADKGSKILGLVLAITDITERKIAEQDLKSAYQSIQSHIDKIREMSWKQSHLIRGPLANVMGLLQMLKTSSSDPQVLEYAETELKRMDEILGEMGKSPL